MLQHEALVLTATLQNDLDSVQQVEARMTEITALLAQFSNLVSEQQTEITNIHETTVQSKKNVEKGHDHLVDAAERTKKSRHYMATVVAFMAFLLLFFNTIKR
jgi:t-SNARE complex subunit (syntaxin)